MSGHLQPEPWLRGTHNDVPAVLRAVLHALELAEEDLQKWCGPLSDAQLNARPAGIAPVAFHLRHLVNAADRLLTYAEGRMLTSEQIATMKSELDPGAKSEALFLHIREGLAQASKRVRAFAGQDLGQPRVVGGKRLPTTLGGLLVHVADHTQRHTGQAIITAKIVSAKPA
jgi:uncharacterized damage-inducible protein DinB